MIGLVLVVLSLPAGAAGITTEPGTGSSFSATLTEGWQ